MAKGDLLEEQLRYEKKFAEVYLEQSKVRREFKLSRVKDINIDPVSAQTAFALNVLLDSIKPALGSAPINSLDPAYKEVFDKQLLRSSDIDEIMLELDNGTVALKFPAIKVKGSSVGQPPTAMRDPQLIPLVNQIEAKFDQLRQETPQKSILEITEELNQMIDALDAKSTEVIGTAPMNAKKGQVYYRTWKQAQEYRARVRSIVNRMALEGTTDVLRSPDGRYDIEKHGNRVVDLVKFVIDNGCKFAPPKRGCGNLQPSAAITTRTQQHFDGLKQHFDGRRSSIFLGLQATLATGRWELLTELRSNPKRGHAGRQIPDEPKKLQKAVRFRVFVRLAVCRIRELFSFGLG